VCRSKSDPCGQRRCPNRPGTQARQRRLRAASRMAEATGAVQAYIGATPFRPESAQLLDLRAYATYYDSDEWIEYDDGIRLAADRHQLNVIEESRADGLWLDETEPAGAYRVFAASEENIRSWAAEVAGRYNQDAVMVAFTDPDGDDDMLTFGDMDGGISTGLALEAMRRAGVPGGRVMGGSLQIVSTSSDPLTKQQIDMLMDRLGPFDVTPVRAEFIEKDTRFLAHSPIKEIQAIRQAHCERHNLPVRRPVPHLSETDDIAAAKPTTPRVISRTTAESNGPTGYCDSTSWSSGTSWPQPGTRWSRGWDKPISHISLPPKCWKTSATASIFFTTAPRHHREPREPSHPCIPWPPTSLSILRPGKGKRCAPTMRSAPYMMRSPTAKDTNSARRERNGHGGRTGHPCRRRRDWPYGTKRERKTAGPTPDRTCKTHREHAYSNPDRQDGYPSPIGRTQSKSASCHQRP